MAVRVFLGLGSNLGNRQENIVAALRMLADSPGLELARPSSLYASTPWGYASKNEFFNCVAAFTLVAGLPYAWQEILAFERRLGKQQRNEGESGYQDRSIDIDVLWSDASVSRCEIDLPHPRSHERAFVLIPWIEVAGEDFILNGKPLQQWLRAITSAERDAVYRVMDAGELRQQIFS